MTSRLALRTFWNSRQPREQRMLAIGAALLSLLLIWLSLIEPASKGRSHWQQTLPRLRSQLAQMRAIATAVAELPARSNTAPPVPDFSRASIERSVRDKGLEIQQLMVSDSGVTMKFSNVTFAALAEWLQQTQSSAQLVVTDATVTARDLPGRVDARLTLQRLP